MTPNTQTKAQVAEGPPHAMRADFINPFINATIGVISTMASIRPEVGRPRLKPDTPSASDVTGIIGLVGEGVEGTMCIGFSKSCILKIASNMIGEEFTEMNRDIEDAVGELTNMISGASRAELETTGYSFQMAIPSVISGQGHSVSTKTRSPVIQIPFSTEFGAFYVEACLSKK